MNEESPKVFKVCDEDWIVAHDMFEAKNFYMEETGVSDYELYDTPVEVDMEAVTRYSYDEGKTFESLSWKEIVDRHVKEGGAIPNFIASTEY